MQNISCLLSCICDIVCVYSQARPSGSTLEDSGEERGHEAGEEREEESGDESRQEREERKKEKRQERQERIKDREKEKRLEREDREKERVEDRVNGRTQENGEVRTYTVEKSEDNKEKMDYYICPHHESLKPFFEYRPQCNKHQVIQ